ncbi:oxygen-independent coproporphyrinogen III oxidase [Halomonas daqingensis]|uniref:Coproporphyrinogen-III oxidase n=1 Tax=Billgrantia desiderata TaxID=52021 RepID=A0AAW4YV84_9GAMM|nr:oxygen-independent coproporphyrinogen III oxidase [Halomonas desiderata]MCE8013800.1 oxygen-independent coproporphyrinogen III oxidase [Halomonas desiderata]MCE8030512.1 oxygen-independent coproporphyrinogen III oxidase [Halomonas desiderata]MCE8052169.1 oxygen-independent coproporphyrinogen III oxidase [Halomonas desiderata]NIC35555.1 oxygen-independent coproporphyrinogen III oxidase [Halomonas desiderata]SEG05558.1 oxygen-independent coproporphyrinogen-3 oxidase [Halomonas desiderata]
MQDELLFNRPLVEKYDRPGPRYTSYPTAPQFHAAFAEDDYRAAAERSNRVASPKPLSVYVHIPFCKSLCYYCACNKIITHNTERAAEYLSWLKQEIGVQGALFDETRRMTQLHLGGGTPTYLSNAQLGELMAALDEAFHFAPVEEREFSLEVDPRTVTPAQIHELHDLGFNRLSFGVQDFDTNVQKAVNRLQSEEQVVELVAAAREAGFQSVSVDLIYGLPLQTVASFDATLDKIIALRPDRIASYSYAHLPELFKAQRLIRPEDMPPPERKLELLELTIRRLTAAGYVYIGMDHFALPDDELTLARENGTLQRNFQGYSTHADCDMIGLGITSIGKVGDSYSQNVKETAQYQARLEEGRLPVMRGYRLNDDDRLRRDVINALMCHGRIDFANIEARHDIVFRDYFAEALAQLEEMQADGLLTIGADAIEVLPAGRLMMRNMAMAFDAYLKPNEGRFSRTV